MQTAAHHLNDLAILLFIAGCGLHTLAQIDAIARAKKLSRLFILHDRWPTILIRTVISWAFFVLWLQGQLADLAKGLNIPLPGFLTAIVDVHIGGAVSLLIGYSFDSILAYIPGLTTTLGVPPAVSESAMPEVKPND